MAFLTFTNLLSYIFIVIALLVGIYYILKGTPHKAALWLIFASMFFLQIATNTSMTFIII